MQRVVLLLFIFGLGQSIYAASLLQFPDLTRRIPERPTSLGCAYKGTRYGHGESVPTPEPCLNCTCIRAVLVCYLRVCPTATAPPPGCFAAREIGECCPTLVCGGADISRTSNKSNIDADLRPTFQPQITDDAFSVNDYSTEITSSNFDSSTDSTEFSENDTSTAYEDSLITINDKRATSVEVSVNDSATRVHSSEIIHDVEISTTDDIYSTVSGTTFYPSSNEDDSLVFITSTREPASEYDMNFYNDIPAGGCMVNGTLYGDGSAMLSSTFCEYCFCIRGKSTCLKPRCHLTIEGCIPRYDNHYTCCPSRYECTQKTPSAESDGTTTTSSTVVDTTQYLGDTIDCFVGGTVYHQGDLIPDHKACHNCYCKDSTVICENIKCSPPIEGCTPIIPQGYCCPISYRCDYDKEHLASNSIKGSYLNDSTVLSDGKDTDIKSVKNYYIHNNANVRMKIPTEQESMSLLHNVVPIQRRLDPNSQSGQNLTIKSLDNESVIHIGSGVRANTNKRVENNMDPIRENDKTLKLEPNDTTSELYSFEQRTFDGIINSFNRANNVHDTVSNIENVTLGSPIVHTLSIQELFDHFFGRQKTNTSKESAETSSEPKRNNSKQPTSIVEIYELDGDIPELTTLKTSTTNFQSLKNDTINTEDLSLNTEIGDLGTHSVIFEDTVKTDKNDSFSDNNDRRTTEIQDMSFNEGEIKTVASSLLFPTTEHRSTANLYSGASTESTYPVLINISDQSDTDIYGEIKDFTSMQTFANQDTMETSPSSRIFTTIGDLFNLKSDDSLHETHTEFEITDSAGIFSDKRKQMPQTSLSPDYSTTKAALIEELKSQTQTRPIVFIYDIKNMHDKNLTTHKATQPTTLLHHSTIFSFPDKTIDYSDAQPMSSLDETTKILIADDSDDQTDTSAVSSTVEDLYNVLKNHGKINSVSPAHITTKNQNNLGITDSNRSEVYILDTTIPITQKNEFKMSPSPVLFFTTTKLANNYDNTEIMSSIQTGSEKNINNDDQSGMLSPLSHTSDINQYNTDKQTLIPFTFITKTDFKKENSLLDTHTGSRPTYYTETTLNEEFSWKTEAPSTSPSIMNTNYQQDVNKNEQKLNTYKNTETFLTSMFSEGEQLNKTGSDTSTKSYLPILTQSKDYTVRAVSDMAEMTQKDTATAETSKIATRINSKLPSFNYAGKFYQNSNNVTTSNYPALTDSFINAYLLAEGRDSDKGKKDFTNVGSVHLGAPLAVGAIDTRKDVGGEKRKITHSDGVIFLDPKFTDIDTKSDLKSIQEDQRGEISVKTQEAASFEKPAKDSNSNEKKKGPRNQDQSKTGQGFKIIPFVAEDAVRGQFGKLNDTLVVQPGVTEGLPDIVSDFCFIKGRIYMNGEMIGKPDPCELCRCFYGRELCQIQRCPTPPPDCVPDKVPGFCCPRFTCGNNGTSNDELKLVGIVLPSEVSTSTTRKPDIIDQKHPTKGKQEMKFGIRVRVRPSPTPVVRISEHATEVKPVLEKTTFKPEIHTISNKPLVTKGTTSKPVTTSKIPVTKTTTTTTTTTTAAKMTTTATPSPLFPDPWGLLKVSGCNIYGKFFNINDQVEILSGPCSHCICTTNGVECNDIC